MNGIRLAQFGLGPIGIAALQLASAKPGIEIVGAIDIDPIKQKLHLGDLTERPHLAHLPVSPSLDDLLARVRPDVMLHTSVSRFADARSQIEPIVRAGIDVISSCEELVFPQLKDPRGAAELSELCRQNRSRVFGTGVNPGFVMDVLPLCLSAVSREVQAIFVRRIVDASTRREPLQRKIGSGLPPDEFRVALRRGRAGHAGLAESMALVAHGLGWKIDEILESADVVVAEQAIITQYFKVAPGQTAGLRQRIEAKRNGAVCLTLDLQMSLGASPAGDSVRIIGEPPLELSIPGGVAGDHATVAALINAVPRVRSAAPGLLLATDLPLPRYS